MKMKKMFPVALLATFFVAFSIKAQPTVKNPSNGMSVELSYNGRQMILRPAESKAIYFLPPSGEARNVRLRYFVGEDIKTVFTTNLNIVSGQELVLPLSSPPRGYVRLLTSSLLLRKINQQPLALCQGFRPKFQRFLEF